MRRFVGIATMGCDRKLKAWGETLNRRVWADGDWEGISMTLENPQRSFNSPDTSRSRFKVSVFNGSLNIKCVSLAEVALFALAYKVVIGCLTSF